MKKLYVLGLGLMSWAGMNAQTYLTKDFEDSSLVSGGWTTQVVVDTTNWKLATYGTPVEKFAKISNYNSTNVAAEAWLISPAIDLTSATSSVVSFDNKMKFAGPALEIKVSTDYDGTSAPSTATWTDVTASATLDTDATAWGGWTNSGEIDLSSYQSSSSVYIAFRYTGSSSDGSTWEVDNILVAEAGTSGGNNGGGNGGGNSTSATPHTIYDIQYTTDASGDSPLKDSIVKTYGIVTAVVFQNSTQKGYYLQDGIGAWNGIYVFDGNHTIQRGDSLMVIGTVAEYYNSTQLGYVDSVVVVSSYNDVSPVVITTADVASEMYENVLCQVQNATCSQLPNTANHNEWTINDGSGDTHVDDFLFSYTPAIGTAYNVTGIVAYAFGNFKMYPRDANDITLASSSTGIEENNSIFKIYPNPVGSGVLTIVLDNNASLSIVNMLGSVVLSQPIYAGNNTINVAHLPAGNYIVRINEKTSMLVVK